MDIFCTLFAYQLHLKGTQLHYKWHLPQIMKALIVSSEQQWGFTGFHSSISWEFINIDLWKEKFVNHVANGM